jgi:hypothetical protein
MNYANHEYLKKHKKIGMKKEEKKNSNWDRIKM